MGIPKQKVSAQTYEGLIIAQNRSMNNSSLNRRPQRSVSSPQFVVSNVAEFFKFNRRRRGTPPISESNSSSSSSQQRQQQQQQGHHYSFAAGVLAASKNFRPFNPSFSRRGRNNSNSNNNPRQSSRQRRHYAKSSYSRSRRRTMIPSPLLPRKEPVISFAAFHDTYSTLGIHEYTKEEISKTWYSRDELATIERDRQRCIRLLERNESLLKDVKYSSRGLEKMTKKRQENYDRNRQLGLDVVFEEQDNILVLNNQRSESGAIILEYDPEIIAASYRAVAIRCHKEAHKVAKKEMLANQAYLLSSKDNNGKSISSKVLSRQAIIMSTTTATTTCQNDLKNINIDQQQEHSGILFTSNQSLLSSSSSSSGCVGSSDCCDSSSQHQIDICSVSHSDGSIASAA